MISISTLDGYGSIAPSHPEEDPTVDRSHAPLDSKTAHKPTEIPRPMQKRWKSPYITMNNTKTTGINIQRQTVFGVLIMKLEFVLVALLSPRKSSIPDLD